MILRVRRNFFEITTFPIIDVVNPWVVEHKTFIEKTYNDRGQQRTDGDIIKEQNSCFTRWFQQKLLSYPLHEDSSAEEQLIFALS